MSKVYVPREESLPHRVVSYFRRLPEEELTAADIALKWQADPKNVAQQLAMAVAHGLLARDGTVYGPGPEIESFSIEPGAVLSARSQRVSRIAPPVDIEGLAFEDIPERAKHKAPRLHDRWVAKLRTMPAGKSFAVSLEHRHALRAAATKLRKEGWTLSVVYDAEGLVRVLCTSVPEVNS